MGEKGIGSALTYVKTFDERNVEITWRFHSLVS